MMLRILRLLAVALAVLLGAQAAFAETAPAQTIWRLLDYIAVDYAGAVSGGRVISAAEYQEMTEFSASARDRLSRLPATPARPGLVKGVEELQAAIAAKADPLKVATEARRLGKALLAAYPVPLGPTATPDLGRGAALFAQNCASCHGITGNGQGPAAKGMDPPPIDFTDRARARERSLFGLYQVIEQGLEGTAMPSFANLSAEDRWALAFRVGSLSASQEEIDRGQQIWSTDPAVRKQLADLTAVVGATPAQIEQMLGAQKGHAVIAYLRAQPEALMGSPTGSLTLAKERLAQALAAYSAGDRAQAKDLALSAYLDGFEPVEPILAARNGPLMGDIESGMGELRARIGRGAPIDEVQEQAQTLDALFTEAEASLAAAPEGGFSTFVSALTILLREGVEALLIVVAMIAFLRKSEREDALPYVHGGWIAALLAGLLTWIIATAFISISGASRELTEGFGGIFAAIVLVSVGIWMHGKSQADAWQRYIGERMSRALTRGSAWFLFGLAFIVVYREVFETILFYAAMWTEGSKAAVISGAAVGAGTLALIAWAMMRYSLQLPIAEFFRYSSILIAALAVVLAGKGIAAIQEAGLLGVTPVDGIPQIDAVGLHPSAQVILAQVMVATALAAGFWINRRTSPKRL